MVRASGSYPEGHKFESHRRYHDNNTERSVLYIARKRGDGPLVKRLRHHPFTVVTWVRVPYGSPAKSTPLSVCFFCCMVTRTGMVKNPSGSREEQQSCDDALPRFCGAETADTRTGHLSWTVWAISFSKMVYKAFPFTLETLLSIKNT